jgi:1-deoxy-D-xylulose-5-phosphate synthase
VAIYSTFLNRAFDQVLMDAALHRCGITFVLDRAGVTGEEGASHNGMWDMSMLQLVPGLRLAAPRDATRFRELLREAVVVADAPTVLRVPKGAVPPDIGAVHSDGGVDTLASTGAKDLLLVAVGAMAGACLEAAERLHAQGIGVTVVDPRWVKPVNPALVELAREYGAVVSVEDNGRTGGCGSALVQAMMDGGVETPVMVCGLPQEFLAPAKRADVHERVGLTGPSLARDVTAWVAALDQVPAARSESTTSADPS